MAVRQFEIWVADLNPRIGTEPGKKRPVVIAQTDFLNRVSHPSTLICPLTTKVDYKLEILRVHLKKGDSNLHQSCDIMVDQLRAIDNQRLTEKVGRLPNDKIELLRQNLRIVMDIE